MTDLYQHPTPAMIAAAIKQAARERGERISHRTVQDALRMAREEADRLNAEHRKCKHNQVQA